jgi:protoporphyrinogen oxidase
MTTRPRILIIGAGPTGLGAAWRFQELGHSDWLLVDAANAPGGLASSVVDEHGFTWDMGGHVLFSHYEYFDRLMDLLLGDAWVDHVRESWVWMRERFIPYPLQNNIWRLPPDDLLPCLRGLLAVQANQSAHSPPSNFRDWILHQFGEGLAEAFMLPYNRKVWAFDPAELSTSWMGERVATVDLGRILENLVLQRDDCGWGPNARFRFPLHGGTGAIWRALHARLPAERVRLSTRIVRISASQRTAWLTDGSAVSYEHLISTMPLDMLLRMLEDRSDLHPRSTEFKHSSSNIVGIGIQGITPGPLKTKCWMYFPEPDVPFYRVTVFSNYSPHNVPEPGRYWSLMAEVSESPQKPVAADRVVNDVERGLRKCRLVPHDATVVSRWHRRLEHGYPTPFLGREALLDPIDAELRAAGIWSRGRFGAWKYEVSNQDHSLMQGVEAADHILFGAEETTYRHPAIVNARKSIGRRPWNRAG